MERENMRIIVQKIGRCLAVGGLLAAPFLGSSPVLAANGVVRINNLGCGMLDGNGQPVAATGEVMITPGQNSVETCRAQVTPPLEGGARWFNFGNTGLLCGVNNVMTSHWREVVNPNGDALLTCIANPSFDR